jgi:hypothetical protein
LERVDKIVDDAANSEMLVLLDMLSPNKSVKRRRREKKFHHPFQNILLRKDVRRTEECRVYIFENDSNSSSPPTSEEHSSIC